MCAFVSRTGQLSGRDKQTCSASQCLKRWRLGATQRQEVSLPPGLRVPRSCSSSGPGGRRDPEEEDRGRRRPGPFRGLWGKVCSPVRSRHSGAEASPSPSCTPTETEPQKGRTVDAIKGQNVGVDSGLEDKGLWPGREGCTPQTRPVPAASHLYTQTVHVGCDQQGTGRDLGKGLMVGLWPLRGLWGVICSPEWQVRKEVACREGWPGSKPSAPGCAPWPVGRQAARDP